MICLLQYLYYEAADAAGYRKKVLHCRECPFREKCNDEAKEETRDDPHDRKLHHSRESL